MIQTFIMPGPAASVIGRVSAVDRAAIAGVIGVTMCVCLAAALPSDRAVAVALVLLAIALALRLAIGTVVDLAATIGFIAGLLSGTHSTMSDARHIATDCLDGSDAIVAGRVIGLPDAHDQFVRFDFVPSRFESSARCELTVPRRARLVWYGGPDLRAGEVWALEVRWRALRNFRNPGAFDYVGWAVERSIDAGGSVRRGRQLTSEEADVTVMIEWDRLREGVVEWLGRATLDHSGLLAAVLVGDAREIDDETWEIFRRSGTVHLLVISGLHITLAAAIGLVLGRGIARLLPRLLRTRGDHGIAGLCAALAAIGYTGLAGWSLPVVRACLMALVGTAWWWSGRRIPAARILLWTLALLLVVDPHATFDRSLWLSFGAVAALVAYFEGRRGLPWSSGWLRAQGVLFVAMAPILAGTVGQFAWMAPLANLVAVPLGLLLVPLVFAALGCALLAPQLANVLLHGADTICDGLLWYLALFDAAPVASVSAPDPVLIVTACVAAGIVLLPIRLWQRMGLVCVIAGAFYREIERTPFAEVRVLVLDVGQGLSVLVDTARHRLLYDAGPKYPSGFDLGEAVVTPAITATGDARLDLLLISHGDMDHRGGAASVQRLIEVVATVSGSQNGDGLRCMRGQSWQWDGVEFVVLHPDRRQENDNDGSCVVRVRAASGGALLTGDITEVAERRLVARPHELQAALLIAPHHGSKTSSSVPFLRVVDPVVVAVSAGHRSRFGHPHAEVMDRYRSLKIEAAVTSRSGALEWRSDAHLDLVPWNAD